MTDYKKLGMHFDAVVVSICHEVFNYIQIGPIH